MKVYAISYKGKIKGWRENFDKATDAVLLALQDTRASMFLTGTEEVKATDFSIVEKEVEFGTPEMAMKSVKKTDSLYIEYGEIEVEDKRIVKGYYDGAPYIADVVTTGTHVEKHVIIHIANVKKDLTVAWTKEEIKVDSFDEWTKMTTEEIYCCLYEE